MATMPILYEHSTCEVAMLSEVPKQLNAMAPRGWECFHVIPSPRGVLLIFRRPMEPRPPESPATEEPRVANAAAIAKVRAIRAGRQQSKGVTHDEQ